MENDATYVYLAECHPPCSVTLFSETNCRAIYSACCIVSYRVWRSEGTAVEANLPEDVMNGWRTASEGKLVCTNIVHDSWF